MHRVKNKLIKGMRYVFSQPKIDYLILTTLCLYIFAVWFEGSDLYFGFDVMYPLRPSLNISNMLYTWSDNNGGQTQTFMTYYFLWSFFFIGEKLGLSLALTQRLFLYLHFILPGLSMYYLTSVVLYRMGSKGEAKRIACWVAALFYMFGPPLLRLQQTFWPYGVAPFVLAFFIQCIDAPELKGKFKYALLASLFLFGFVLHIPTLNIAVVLLLILVIYSALYVLFERGKTRQLLVSWAVFGGLAILINLWSTLPWLLMVLREGTSIANLIPLNMVGEKWGDELPYAVVRNLTLTASLGPEAGGGEYAGFYFRPSPMIYFVNISLAITAFSAILIRPRSKMPIFFALLSLLAILVNIGPNPPIGGAFKWLVSNVIYLRFFRTVGANSMYEALGYAVLIGITVSQIYPLVQNRLSGNRRMLGELVPKGITLVVVILVLINGWPMVTGAYYKTPGVWKANVMHEVPPSYYEVNDWLDKQDDSQNYRLLVLPAASYLLASWPTGGYYGGPVIPYISSRPVIVTKTAREGLISPMVKVTYDASGNDYNLMAKLAGLLNVKYFYVDDYDTYSGYLAGIRTAASEMTTANRNLGANDSAVFSYETSFDKLDVYSIDDEFVFPRVYATAKVHTIAGDIEPELAEFLEEGDFPGGKPVFFLSEQMNPKDWEFVSGLEMNEGEAKVTFEQVNPTKYLVHLTTSGPVFLVLSTQFNSDWVASVKGERLTQHLMANGYANAWYVDKEGSYDVILEYRVQRFFHAGILLSLLTFFGSAGYVGKEWFRGKDEV